MVKRIAPDAKVTSVVTIEDIEALAKETLELMFDLTGMTALVTGASGGLGSAIARALAAQGARLALSGSNAAKLEAFAEELGGDHVDAGLRPVRCAQRSTSWSRGRSRRSAQLDILVNNAGVTRDNLPCG